MATKSFSAVFQPSPGFRWLNRIILAFLAVHVVLASYSGYRAIVQIRRVELDAPERVLHVGSVITVRVVSSGRAEADAGLELIQGTRSLALGRVDLPRNHNASYDPRTQHGAFTVVLTPEHLAGFAAGRAVLRATGYGSSQWLRIPPPVVREIPVEITLPD